MLKVLKSVKNYETICKEGLHTELAHFAQAALASTYMKDKLLHIALSGHALILYCVCCSALLLLLVALGAFSRACGPDDCLWMRSAGIAE